MAYINVDEVYILDNTGLQVDMATDIPFVDAGFSDAQKAQARKNIAAGGTNPNLLDNPWFTVNQRGVSGYINGSNYGVDRWKASTTSSLYIVMGTGFMTLPASGAEAAQILEGDLGLQGKYVTFSVLDDTGVIRSAINLIPSTLNVQNYMDSTVDGVRLRLRWTGSQWVPRLNSTDGADHTIKAAKLEVGQFSTLANDVAPDYGTELAKCQRYLRAIYAKAGGTYIGVGMGTSTNIYTIEFPFSMRATPVPSLSGTIDVYAPSGVHTVSSVTAQPSTTDTICLNFTVNGTVNVYEMGHFNIYNNARLLLSAEL